MHLLDVLAASKVKIVTCHAAEYIHKVVIKAHSKTSSSTKHSTFWIAHVHLIILIELEHFQFIAVISEKVAKLRVGVVKTT